MVVFGFLLTGLVARPLRLTAVARLALAVPALLAFVTVVMVIHMVTGGEILSRPSLVRGATAIVALAMVFGARRPAETEPKATRETLWAIGLAAVAVAVWSLPVFTDLPVNFSGDVKRHSAWAAQLSAGHTTPTAVITGEIPNYYPWLFHALTSFLAVFTPGERVLHAFGPLQVLATAGSSLAFFGAGSVLFGTIRAAASTAVLGGFSGGFGFLLTQRPALELDPRAGGGLEFLGDFMFVRSYNLAFHNLAPPFPRDLGFLLLVGMLVLVALGVAEKRWPPFVGAGCVVGLIGLVTGESLIVGAAAAAVLVAIGPGIARITAAVAIFVPMIAVYALWAVPIAISYARLGGFADTSGDPVTLSPAMVLFSWGIATPLAALGIGAWRRWPVAAQRVVAALAVAALMALIGSALAPVLGEGFTTLERDHRYWPLLYMAIALCGGYGADFLFRRLSGLRPALGIVVAVMLGASAIASPLLASAAVPRAHPENEVLTAALTGDESNVLEVVARESDGRCVAAIPGPFSRAVPSYSGARLVYFPSDTRNQAGIRWPEIPEAIPDAVREADNALLIRGGPTNDEWLSTVERYDVDVIVVPATHELSEVMASYPRAAAEAADSPYWVVRTGACDKG